MAKKIKATTPEKMSTRDLEIIVRQGEHFFDNEYLQYCIYVLEQRALPSIIDGLKPGARKIMHAAFHILTESKKSNFMDLVGTTMSYSKYHHGDAALLGTIKTLGTLHSDNTAPLKLVGSAGDLRSPESAAGRYLYVKLSKFAKILKKNSEILDYNYDGVIKVEPKYYLPIIPLVLTSRTTGLGVGFSFNMHISYNPVSIIDECIAILKTGKIKNPLIPHINEFSGSFHDSGKGRIYAKGIYKIKGNLITINDFAPNVTSKDFEINLEALYQKGYIVKYDDDSENSIEYNVLMSSDFMSKYGNKPEKIEKYLMLGQVLKRPTLTVLNEHGKFTEFETVEDVLQYFVEFREYKYATLKSHIVAKLKEQILVDELMRKFIDLFLSGKIKISKDIKIADTIKQMATFDIPEEYINTRISKLTKEEYDKLGKQIESTKAELLLTENTAPKDMYINDLTDLRKTLVDDFPFSKLEILHND